MHTLSALAIGNPALPSLRMIGRPYGRQQKYTVGGEFDYNGVLAPSGGSTYIEVGAF
jgi:hypothetical protein